MAGTTLTLTQMLDETRQMYLDLDTTDQAFSDANLTKRINYWYHWWFATYSPQGVSDASTLSFSSGNKVKPWTPGDNLPLAIVNVRASASGEGINLLQRIEMGEMEMLQLKHVAGAATATNEGGLPTTYAIQPVEPATGSGAALTYNVYVYPVPDATTTVIIYQRAAPDDLASGGDTPRCTPFDSRLICRAAAVDCAALTGDFDLSQALLRSLPQEMQAAMGVRSEFLKPNAAQLGKTNA